MKKSLEKAAVGRSSKKKILAAKALLPEDPKKAKVFTSGPATEKKDTVLPEKQEPGPIGPGKKNLELTNDLMESSGLARALFCGGFDFVLVRSSKSRLTDMEKNSLSDPLDKIEIKLMGYLPEVIRKHAGTAGPVIELLMAATLIMLSRRHEITSGPATEKKETVLPEKQAPAPIGPENQKPEINTKDLPLSLQPIRVEDQAPAT